MIELEEVPVWKVLKEEEKRPNFEFIHSDLAAPDVVALFAEHELLEAVLITQNGNRDEKLLGIVTRWDIVHLKRD